MSKAYPKYKPSGVEWLGDVPEHWVVKQFRHCIRAIKDGTHGTFERTFEGHPFLSAKNVFESGINISDNESLISDEDYREITANGFPRKNDLLLTIVGTIGRTCVYPFDEKHAFQRSVCFIRLNQNCVPSYYKFFILSKYFQEQLINLAKVSAQSGVYMGDVLSCWIHFPPLPEQQAIAAFLDHETGRIDALIAKKQRLLELLAEQRTAMISRAVTKGLNASVKLKPSGVEWLGDVPEHWGVMRLKYQVSINDETLPETTDPDYEMLYVDISSVDPTQGIVQKEGLLFENAPSRARRIVKDGDTIVSTVRTYLRAISPVIEPEENLVVSTGFAVIRPRKMDKDYLSATIRAPYFIEEVVSRSVGVSYPAINASEIGLIPVPLPPLPEQQAIAAFLDRETGKIDALSAKVTTVIERLKEYRTALISSAVTGKIDVREAI